MAKRVRGSTTGRPIMVLLDLLGRRWTLRIVWELRDAPRRFRELLGLFLPLHRWSEKWAKAI